MRAYPIKQPEWNIYYQTLEDIREEGIVNMWGASPELANRCQISLELANDILLSWIANYNTLKKRFKWEEKGDK